MSSDDTLVFLEVHLYQTGLQILLILALPEVLVVPEGLTLPESLTLPEVPESLALPEVLVVPEGLTLPVVPEVPESLTLPEVPEVLVVPVVPVAPVVLPLQLVEPAVVESVSGYRPTLLPEQSAASHCRIPWCRMGTRQILSLALLDLAQGP